MLAVASCLDPASFLDISPLHCHVIAHVCHMRQCLRENQLTSLFLRWVISFFTQQLSRQSNSLDKASLPTVFGREQHFPYTSIHYMLLRDKTYTSSQIIVFASNTSSSVMLNILSDFVITARDSIFQSLLYHLLSTVCSHVLAFLPLLLFLMIYRSLPIALGVL